MIVTVTANPSVDIQYELHRYQTNTVNRVAYQSKTAGGKGLNVTRVLRQLNEDVVTTGFLGGYPGAMIREKLSVLGVTDRFTTICGETRNCIAMMHDGSQTEILETGPDVSAEEIESFYRSYSEIVREAAVITISGSLPGGVDSSFYTHLLKVAHEAGKPVLLDTKGDTLSEVLDTDFKPTLIKPNLEELEEMVGKKVASEIQIIEVINDTMFSQIEWIVITLGSAGALIRHKEQFFRAKIPTIKAINPVGSGDSVIAGFASGMKRGLDETEMIKYSLAMGVLNAAERETGKIIPENVKGMMEQIEVVKLL